MQEARHCFGRRFGGFKNDEPSTSGQTLPARKNEQPAEAEYLSYSSGSDTNMDQSNDRNVFYALGI